MKRILTTLSQKWPEYILEMIVITAGILGAYALNNWNENRKSNVEVRSILKNLKVEFESNLVTLKSAQNGSRILASSGSRVLSYFYKSELPNEATSDTLILNVLIAPKYDPSYGALLDATNSGKINLIRNDSLRARLLSFKGDVEKINRRESEMADDVQLHLLPYLYKRYAMADFDARFNSFDVEWHSSRFDSDLQNIYNDREFENMIDNHTWHGYGLLNEYNELEKEIKTILKHIESETKKL